MAEITDIGRSLPTLGRVALSSACDATHRERVIDSTSRHPHHLNRGVINDTCISNILNVTTVNYVALDNSINDHNEDDDDDDNNNNNNNNNNDNN